MARITGSTTINWSGVSLGRVDFVGHFHTFASRVRQLLAAFYSGNYDIVSPGSTLLVLDMRFGGRLSLSGSGLDGPAPVIRTIDFKNPANGSGEVLRATGTVNGGTEILTSATIGSSGFFETVNGIIQIPDNFLTSGAYVGNLTSLVARVGSATVTFRGTFGLSGNLSGASMAGTVTGITVVSGGGAITMTGLSLSWDGIEAALAADTLATVEDLLAFVGNHMPGNDAITYTNRSGAGMTFVGGAGNDSITILGPHGDTLVGGDGDDVLDGGLGLDTIIGGGGNDRIIMLVTPGNTDTINAGPGIDTLVLTGTVPGDREVVVNLSSTTDQVVSIGGAVDGPTQINVEHLDASRIVGFVSATGGAGDNVLIGSRGNDTLDGGDGDDVLDGGRGQDAVLGGAGHDRITMLVTAGDVDTIDAGTGVDTLILVGAVPGNRRVLVDLSQVDQVVSIGGLLDVPVQSNFENLDASKLGGVVEATGGAGDNVLIGSRGHDVLIGGAGDDVLIGGPGNDTLSGGPGDDTYVIGQGTDVLVEEPGAGTDLVESSITHALGPNFENLTLTGTKPINGTGNELNNVIIGNGAANVLEGGAGNDTLIGNGGNDRLDGGVGDDAMEGGAGNDTYIVDSLGDTVTESLAGAAGGIDLVLSAVDFTLGPNVEHLTLTGTADLAGTGNELNNILIGNSGNNVLEGGAGTDTLSGGAGDDILAGGTGNDTLNGGSGNDTYLFGLGDGQDVIQDGGGTTDRLVFDSGIDPFDLVLSRRVNDLRIMVQGTSDHVTIRNWYASANNRIETIEAGGGQVLLSTQVNQLLQAMATFTRQTGLSWEALAGGAGTAQQQTDFQNILAANWQ
jgi:Ca2+-binding RTX toxin-like protein